MVNGIMCKKCKDVIYSRSVHDFRWCECKAVAIDGGRMYTKITGALKDIQPVKITIVNPKL